MTAQTHRSLIMAVLLSTGIRSLADREDIAQRTAIKYHQHQDSVDPSKAKAWLYGVARNEAIDDHRRRARRRESQMDSADVQLETAVPDPILRRRIEDTLSLLSPEYRAIIVHYDVMGRTHAECAAALGCEVSTSRARLCRARAEFRARFGESPIHGLAG